MSRSALLACAVALAAGAAACGPKVPQHTGYKSPKSQPWTKAKAIALKNGAAEVEGELAYATYRRAKWWAIDLPGDGELTVTLEQHAGGDRKVDIALEVLDPSYQVIGKTDSEEEDAFEEEKTRTFYELRQGRYLVHLYLQGRLDAAEYELRVKYAAKAISGGGASDLAAALPFPPDLPVVPIEDDTPQTKPRPRGSGPRRDPDPKPEPTPTVTTAVTARIINVSVAEGGIDITINRGIDHGLADGAKARVQGIKNPEVSLKGCTNRSCRAFVRATPDEVAGKSVTVGQ